MTCRLNMGIRKMSLWLQRYIKKTSAANIFKNLRRVTAKYVKSEVSTANRAVLTSLEFVGLVTLLRYPQQKRTIICAVKIRRNMLSGYTVE